MTRFKNFEKIEFFFSIFCFVNLLLFCFNLNVSLNLRVLCSFFEMRITAGNILIWNHTWILKRIFWVNLRKIACKMVNRKLAIKRPYISWWGDRYGKLLSIFKQWILVKVVCDEISFFLRRCFVSFFIFVKWFDKNIVHYLFPMFFRVSNPVIFQVHKGLHMTKLSWDSVFLTSSSVLWVRLWLISFNSK